LDEGQEVEQDEFRCLNLNVSLPDGLSSRKELLPVLIWIHGKALYIGELHMRKPFACIVAD
jgi:carboxylesterase type B